MPIASRRERIFSRYPDLVSGYELNPEHGYFSVIIPEATTNLCINPSVEDGVGAGWGAYNSVLSIISTWQAYGVNGVEIEPTSLTESGGYFGNIALANGTTYTASITIQGEAGKLYYIWLASNAGALIGTKRAWIGTGHKQRIHVTHRETTGADRRVYVTRDAKYVDTNLFYMDGLQVEAKSYPTSYVDGSQLGFVIGETAYQWTGAWHASTSTRSAQTRAGGREVNLLDLGFRVLSVIGLGMAVLVDQSLAIPGFGELMQGTGTQAREFTLVGALSSDTDNPRYLMAMRSGLIDAFKPDLVTTDQPLVLGFQAQDEEGEPLGEKVQIVAKYRGGLEGNWDNHQGERLAINFKQYIPYIQSAFDSGVELGYQEDVNDADYALYRETNGQWTALSTGLTDVVYVIKDIGNGTILLGGAFTNVGDANGDRIVGWNGSAFSSYGTGTDGNVYAIAKNPDDTFYIGGAFTLAGGVANTIRIAKWTGIAWEALSTGIAGGGADAVRALAIDANGDLIVGGRFADVGDANGDNIVKWDVSASAWVSLGTGTFGPVSGTVYAIAIDSNNNIYIGGQFTLAGGVANTVCVAMWNGATWEPLGTGMNNTVYALALAPNGELYAGGAFTTAGGVAALKIAKWNGIQWSPVSTGTNDLVYTLTFDKNGLLYAGGDFTTAGGITLPDRGAIWNGSSWFPFDVNFPGNASIEAIEFDHIGRSYFGFNTSGTAVSATVNVPPVGSAKVYPTVSWNGPGTVWQLKSYTTGKAIYFNNLTLLPGEFAVLVLEPTSLQFWSNFRGNLLNYILPGSDMNFELLPGNNNISTFMYGSTTAASSIVMAWKDSYWSLDGTVWK